jgi:TonB family protein
MTAYIIKSSLSLLLLFGLYWFLLRKEKLFVFNRFFLVASVVFSLLVPFISIHVNLQTTPRIENLIPVYNRITQEYIINDNADQNAVYSNQQFSPQKAPLITIPTLLIVLYLTGTLLFLVRFLRNLFLIARRSRLSEKIGYNGFQILLTKDQTGPCCFFNHIFLNREDYLNGRIDKDLLNHEIEHARQSHTIDIILIELVKVFYWFNPIYLLYDRAIRINHEYLADNGVINADSDIKSYTDKLLNLISCSSNMSLTSGSNNTFTKMRLIMIMKSHSGSFRYGTRIAATLCMVTIFFVLLSFKDSKYQSSATNSSLTAIEIQQNTVKGIVLTVDGKPLIDAAITVLGPNNTSLETLAFPDGRFTLRDIQPGSTLRVECRGFKTQTLKADFLSMMTVKMVRDPEYKGKVTTTEIHTANFRNSDFTSARAFVVINEEILDKNGKLTLNPKDIKTLRVLTDKEATDKYGDKGKDGVLEITLFGKNSESQGNKRSVSKSIDSDTSKYKTHISINHVVNKGELIDIPLPNLQYISVWSYHDTEKSNKKEFRTIDVMTRDYFKVRGKVLGENEKPLSGVKISVSDNPAIVISDKDGRFLIQDVKDNTMLEFSLPEYKPYYLATGGAVFTNELEIELEKENGTEKNEIYTTVEKMPQYPGGDMELNKFIAMNLIYPEAAKTQKAEGVVIVRFVVNTKGNLEDAQIVQKVHPALDSEVIRVVSKLERFIPGSQGGKPVSVYYLLPITFALPVTNTSK